MSEMEQTPMLVIAGNSQHRPQWVNKGFGLAQNLENIIYGKATLVVTAASHTKLNQHGKQL